MLIVITLSFFRLNMSSATRLSWSSWTLLNSIPTLSNFLYASLISDYYAIILLLDCVAAACLHAL